MSNLTIKSKITGYDIQVRRAVAEQAPYARIFRAVAPVMPFISNVTFGS